MLKLIILLSLFFLTGCAHNDAWRMQDTWMQIGVTAVLIGDAVTTARIRDCANCYESGPIAKRVLGPQPDPGDTYIYFSTLIISNYLISRSLPAKWRPYWQSLEMGVHGYAISQNCNNGLC